MSFGERVKKYIKHKSISVRKFEQESNLKNGAIHRVITNGTSLNGESIASVGKRWEDLNLNWLMKGDGDMLLLSSSVKDPVNEYNKDLKLTNEIKYLKDALRRADSFIELQKEMITKLNAIIDDKYSA